MELYSKGKWNAPLGQNSKYQILITLEGNIQTNIFYFNTYSYFFLKINDGRLVESTDLLFHAHTGNLACLTSAAGSMHFLFIYDPGQYSLIVDHTFSKLCIIH